MLVLLLLLLLLLFLCQESFDTVGHLGRAYGLSVGMLVTAATPRSLAAANPGWFECSNTCTVLIQVILETELN